MGLPVWGRGGVVTLGHRGGKGGEQVCRGGHGHLGGGGGLRGGGIVALAVAVDGLVVRDSLLGGGVGSGVLGLVVADGLHHCRRVTPSRHLLGDCLQACAGNQHLQDEQEREHECKCAFSWGGCIHLGTSVGRGTSRAAGDDLYRAVLTLL
ncbi:hypothetical protein [Granulimonas faecalis]|uniref:hypothetical protein n=1 Tax=Granulimonas faecalis TaxID=2894155 RepID=UPI0035194E91